IEAAWTRLGSESHLTCCRDHSLHSMVNGCDNLTLHMVSAPGRGPHHSGADDCGIIAWNIRNEQSSCCAALEACCQPPPFDQRVLCTTRIQFADRDARGETFGSQSLEVREGCAGLQHLTQAGGSA